MARGLQERRAGSEQVKRERREDAKGRTSGWARREVKRERRMDLYLVAVRLPVRAGDFPPSSHARQRQHRLTSTYLSLPATSALRRLVRTPALPLRRDPLPCASLSASSTIIPLLVRRLHPRTPSLRPSVVRSFRFPSLPTTSFPLLCTLPPSLPPRISSSPVSSPNVHILVLAEQVRRIPSV
eukprot:332295-Hanusia_phi.AAC.2